MALAWSLAVCVLAAVLEGLAGGSRATRRLSTLRMPRFSPPLAVWFALGAVYYGICGVVLYRLLDPGRAATPPGLSLSLLLLLMSLNITWTFAFARLRALTAAAVILALYVAIALGLFGVLWASDRTAAWAFAPYLAYLAYASLWFRALSRANRHPDPTRGDESGP